MPFQPDKSEVKQSSFTPDKEGLARMLKPAAVSSFTPDKNSDWEEIPNSSPAPNHSADEWEEINPEVQRQRDFDTIPNSNELERENQKALPGRLAEGLPLTAAMATDGTSLWIPPLAVGAASLAKQYIQGKSPSFGETGMDVALNAGPGMLGKLKGFFRPAAERVEMLRAVKDPTTLEPLLESKAALAKESFNKSQIAPRMLEQTARADEQMIPLSTSELSRVPELQPMIEEAQSARLNGISHSGYSSPQVPDVLNFPAKEALKMRQIVNAQTPSFENQNVYREVGNHIRSALSDVDMNMSQLSKEMEQAYDVKSNVFGSRGQKDALSATYPTSGKSGLAKKARLQTFDNLSNSPVSLEKMGENVKTAQQRLEPYTWNGLKKLLTIGAPKELFELAETPVARSYDAVGNAIYNTKGIPASEDAARLYYLMRASKQNDQSQPSLSQALSGSSQQK